MSIPEKTIEKWQSVWQHICEMAYHRNNITDQIQIYHNNDYETLMKYKNICPNDFEKLTLDYTWKKVSAVRDSNGEYIDVQVVPELVYIYIPRILFETLGVYAWFKVSFPNCKIIFWEDDMKYWKPDSPV
jgi:hypothetical protein